MTNSYTTLTVVPAKFLQESRGCIQEGCGLTMHQPPAIEGINLQDSTRQDMAGQGPLSPMLRSFLGINSKSTNTSSN